MKKSVLNIHFDKIYCITCFDDNKRQERCKEQFLKYNIDFEFVSSINPSYLKKIETEVFNISSQEFSLTISHMKCMQNSILNGYKKIVIFEDDFELYTDWETRFEYFISEIPDDWQILYLGEPEWVSGIYDSVKTSYSPNASICKYGCASHFMAFNHLIFLKCIEKMKTLKYPVDVYYGEIMKESTKCFTPSIKSLADALSLPHEKYHNKIKNFDKNKYIPSTLRSFCNNP